MEIKNIDGLSPDQLRGMVAQGGKFVMYKYCISIVVMTFNRPSNIYFIKPGKSGVVPGLGFLATNLFLGWWGIPWGPIYTIGNISRILMGGKDITTEVMANINQNDQNYGHGTNYNVPGSNNNAGSGNGYNVPSGGNAGGYNVPSGNNQSNNNSSGNYNIPR